MSVDNLQIIAAETAVYICYVSSIHTSHAQFRVIFRSFNPQLYIFLVLFPVNLWPIWKASLVATAATILWKFNVFWAMALPLTSVTGNAGVHVFNDDKLYNNINNNDDDNNYTVLRLFQLLIRHTRCSVQRFGQHSVRVHTADRHCRVEDARDCFQGSIECTKARGDGVGV